MAKSIGVIRLSGELEIGRKAEIAAALTLGGNVSAVLLDFADVSYADSTTLAEMLRFRDEASGAGIPVVIVIGSKQFARLIQYAGLAQAFRIFDDRGAALTELSRLAQP